MRIRISHSNANAAQTSHNVLRHLAEKLRQAGIDITARVDDPSGGNDLTLHIWRKEDSTSQVLAIEHVHDDGSADHDKGDSVIGDSSVLPIDVSDSRTLDPGRVYSAEELQPVKESDEKIEDEPSRSRLDEEAAAEAKAENELNDARRDPEAFSVNDLIGETDAGSAGDAVRQSASERRERGSKNP